MLLYTAKSPHRRMHVEVTQKSHLKKKNGFDWFHSGNADAPNPGQPNETPVALYAWHGSVVRNALWELNHG